MVVSWLHYYTRIDIPTNINFLKNMLPTLNPNNKSTLQASNADAWYHIRDLYSL